MDLAAPVGLTVREMLTQADHAWVMDCAAYITLESENRVEVVTDFDIVPAVGETLCVRVVPQGGGGGGKNPLGALLSIAVMAIAPQITPYLATSLITSGIVTGIQAAFTIAKIVVGLGGMALSAGINALAGGQAKPPSSGITQNSQTSSIYTITGTANAANKFGPIPTMVGGKTRVWPTLAAEPYTEVAGEDQYIRQRFAIIGPVELSEFKIGETAIENFEDVEVEWIQGFDGDALPTLYADGQDIDEESVGAAMLKASDWITRTTALATKEITYDINQTQLFRVSGSKYVKTSVEYEVGYRETGTTGDWLAPALTRDGVSVGSTVDAISETYDIDINTTATSGTNTLNTISTQLPVVGDLVELAYTEVTTTTAPVVGTITTTTDYTYSGNITGVSNVSGDEYNITLDTNLDYAYPTDTTATLSTTDGFARRVTIEGYYTNARLFSYRFTVPEGQYDVRLRRITEDNEENTTIFDSMSWQVLRSISEHPGIDTTNLPPLSVIDLRIKASGQLNGVVNQFNCIAEAYLPVWDGDATVTYELSDNPAWAFFNVLYGLANKRRITDLSRYDYTSLSTWADLCEAQGWKVNGIIDTSTTVYKQLATIASLGRASLSMVNNKYGVAVDWEKDTVVQVFTPRNSWGFESTKVWPEKVHAARVRFVDEDSGYELSEGFVYADGYTEANATLFAEQEIQWATNWTQVWKNYRYQLADRILRPEIYSFSVDVENLRCVRGDRVRLVHDVMQVGLGQARIKTVTVDGSDNVTSATIDTLWALDTTTSYAINIQRKNGSVYEGFIDNPLADGDYDTITFSTPIPAAVAPVGGELITFGEADTGVGLDLIIHEIQPGANLTAKLLCQDYAPGIQSAADGTIGAYDPKIQYGRNYRNGRPNEPIIESVVSDESALIVANDGTIVTRAIITIAPNVSPIPYDGIKAQYRADGNDLWETIGTFPPETNSIVVSNLIDGDVYDFRVQAYTAATGATSDWVYELGHTVIGKTSLPPDLGGMLLDGDLLRWTYPDKPVDFAGFRLRYAIAGTQYSWGAATPVTGDPLISVQQFDISGYTGSLVWLCKAEDTTGNQSQNAAVVITNLGGPALTNVLETWPEAPTWSGTITGGTVVSGELVADGEDSWTGVGSNVWWTGNGAYQIWGSTEYGELMYEWSTTFEVGGELVISRDMSDGSYIEFTKESSDQSWTGVDSFVGWSGVDSTEYWDGLPDWQAWVGGLPINAGDTVYFRAIAPAGQTQGVFTEITPTIDVPDVEETIQDVTISTSGTRLTLTNTYQKIKAIVYGIQDNGLGTTGVRVVDKNVDLGPLLQAETADALVDVRVQGY